VAAENKTRATCVSVDIEQRRTDARVIIDLMARISGEPATMWGPSIIGFGRHHYRYDSGREGEVCRLGFSPRKAELVFYIPSRLAGRDEMLAALGKHRTGKACVYVKKLADVDMAVLERMIDSSWEHNRAHQA
jgi:hypothetical protein